MPQKALSHTQGMCLVMRLHVTGISFHLIACFIWLWQCISPFCYRTSVAQIHMRLQQLPVRVTASSVANMRALWLVHDGNRTLWMLQNLWTNVQSNFSLKDSKQEIHLFQKMAISGLNEVTSCGHMHELWHFCYGEILALLCIFHFEHLN